MNNSTITGWVVAAIVLIVVVVGFATWYSATPGAPGVPNTGVPGADTNTLPAATPSGGVSAY